MKHSMGSLIQDEPTEWLPTTIPDVGNFRSRIEAKWALALRQTQVPWVYEPFQIRSSGHVYTPDFLVDETLIVEVKAECPENADRYLALFGLECLDDYRCLMVVGRPIRHACVERHAGTWREVVSPFLRMPWFDFAAEYAEMARCYESPSSHRIDDKEENRSRSIQRAVDRFLL